MASIFLHAGRRHRGESSSGSSDDATLGYLKFSGIVEVTSNPQSASLGDAGAVVVDDDQVAYPVARKGKLKDLAVSLSPAVTIPDGATIVAQLYRNGSALSDFLVEWGAGEVAGTKSERTDARKFRRDDTLELRLSFTGSPAGWVAAFAAIGLDEPDFLATATIATVS